jgi:hypothetical protein
VTPSVIVYGFGSAFNDMKAPNDVDLLIVHHGTNPASCELAITCKRRLAESVAHAHITMLSNAEEAHFQFIKTARAVCLGTIREDHFDGDLVTLKSALSVTTIPVPKLRRR